MPHPHRLIVCLIVVLMPGMTSIARAVEVMLADAGRANLPIVVSVKATPELRAAADELSSCLHRITGASFDVTVGDGSGGIVLGTPESFDKLPFSLAFEPGLFARDTYLLRSTATGVYILGATPLATRFGMWDLLHRFGYRHFFPTPTWEVVPRIATLTIDIDDLERPDYISRRGPRGASRMHTRTWAVEHWERWQVRNRITANFQLNTGHAYGRIMHANRQAFAENPDYYGLIDGERRVDAQPNVAHPAVQKIFIDYALGWFERYPDSDSVAMDPLDGRPWSESPESMAIGGPTEQAVFLANKVAEAVVERFGPEKYVGIYAYAHHSPPPNIAVHPNVIVSLATSFIRGGYTFDELLEGWSKRANLIGIREYYGLPIWYQSLPGQGRAADTEYLRRTIPEFHRRGARFMNAESDDTWGGYGLGYYLATRMLWDITEADRLESIIADFIEKAFGPAREPMARFYALIDGSARDPIVPSRRRALNDDMVGRMYRHLAAARELASARPDVLARIDDLILYTHYVELHRRFDRIHGPERQAAFDTLVRFIWRIRARMMIDSPGLIGTLDRFIQRDSNVNWPGPRVERGPSEVHLQGADEPFVESQITSILAAGIEAHPLLDLTVELVGHDDDLLPAGFAPVPAAERGGTSGRVNRSPLTIYLWTPTGTLPRFTFEVGQIYQDRGPLRWELYNESGDGMDEGEVPPDGQSHTADLKVAEPGLYRLEILNTGQGFVWTYEPRDAKLSIRADDQHDLGVSQFTRLYFYVPANVEQVVLAGTLRVGRFQFMDGDARAIDSATLRTEQGFTMVPVPAGQAGRVWSLVFRNLPAGIRFLNIPGYVAFTPDELLLPRAVVRRLGAEGSAAPAEKAP